MCLRYAFTSTDYRKIPERFVLGNRPGPIKARYNLAPAKSVPAIFNDGQNAPVHVYKISRPGPHLRIKATDLNNF